MTTPEARARADIDRLLEAAGWHVCNVRDANLNAARGVAIREFSLAAGHGEADYLLYIDGKAAGVIEAKKKGTTLTGVELQSTRYSQGLPATLPAWARPLPFAFHRPETLAGWLELFAQRVQDAERAEGRAPSSRVATGLCKTMTRSRHCRKWLHQAVSPPT